MRLLLQTNYFDDTDRLLQAYEIDTLEGMARSDTAKAYLQGSV